MDSPDFLSFLRPLHSILVCVAPLLAIGVALASFCATMDGEAPDRGRFRVLLVATLLAAGSAAAGWWAPPAVEGEPAAGEPLALWLEIGLLPLLVIALVLTRLGAFHAPSRAGARIVSFAAAGLATLSLQLGATEVLGEGWLSAAVERLQGDAPPKATRTVEAPKPPPVETAEPTAVTEPVEVPKVQAPDDAEPEDTDLAPAEPVVRAPIDLEARLAELDEHGLRAQRTFQGAETIEVNATFLATDFGDEDLRLLAGLETRIETLVLSTTGVTDAAGEVLAGLSALDSLRLDRTAFGDAGLAALAGSPVRVLNLYGSTISDAGLGALSALPRLERVFVWDTAVTEEGVRALEEARPSLEVVRSPGPRSPGRTEVRGE